MDKIKTNARLVVLILIIAGVALLLLSTGENSKLPTATEENVAMSPPEQQGQDNPDLTELETESKPSNESAVMDSSDSESDDVYKAVIKKGDNQTIIARQIITEYLNKQSKNLSEEQRLYVETLVVDSMPRNNVIYEGNEIVVASSTISNAVDNSASLTETQLARWATYL